MVAYTSNIPQLDIGSCSAPYSSSSEVLRFMSSGFTPAQRKRERERERDRKIERERERQRERERDRDRDRDRQRERERERERERMRENKLHGSTAANRIVISAEVGDALTTVAGPQQDFADEFGTASSGSAFLAVYRGFRVSSGTVQRYRSSHGTDFDTSERASPVYFTKDDGWAGHLREQDLRGSSMN